MRLKKKKTSNGTGMSRLFGSLATNASLLRTRLADQLFDPRRDIAKEAGYPETITSEMYRRMYDREGVAQRVVHFWPEESWTLNPQIFENEEASETAFEVGVENLIKSKNVNHFLQRIDEVSGIGRYGIMLLGFDDGGALKDPIDGFDDLGPTGTIPKKRKLMFLRLFSEDAVEIDLRENDPTNPRFGKPMRYTVQMTEFGPNEDITTERKESIHWSRLIHVADRKEMSETFGTPRMKPLWNRLLDLMKVMGGSGEMFWKGAFPGYSIETHPDTPDVDLDTSTLREQLQNYFNGLQRYLALTGVTVKSLTPQMADPTNHRNAIMDEIAFTMNVPKRKLFGSEQAQLASGQDARTFNGRVMRRNENYVSPEIVRNFWDRMINTGVVPPPATMLEDEDGFDYTISWPDLNTVTNEDKAKVAKERTEALAKYVSSGVDAIIPPEQFLTLIMGMDLDEVEVIMKAAEEFQADEDRILEEAEAAALEIAATQQLPAPPEEDLDDVDGAIGE